MNTMSKEEYFDKVRSMTDHVKKQIPKRRDLSEAHLDHIVPVVFGYDNNIPPEILSLPENLKYISKMKNLKKGQSLTAESVEVLKAWIDQGKVDKKLQFFINQEIEFKKAKEKYDFSAVYEAIKKHGAAVIENLPSEIAYTFIPVWCQRRHDLRWEKTKKAMGHIPLFTHRMMTCGVYPDGRIERLDGNTRSYIFNNDLQFSDYEKPETWFVTFIPVRDADHAAQLYHSIDSTETAETFAEKISGYLHAKGYHVKLPEQFQKGEKVYDIAIVAIDGYVPPNETEQIYVDKTSDMAQKAKTTVNCLDYFIQELVTLGSLINNKSVPKSLSSPLMGMLIRYLMVNKSKECEDLVRTVINFTQQKIGVFDRPKFATDMERNILIMLDELKTPDETFHTENHHITYRSTTTRMILPEYATKTTVNTGDRRLYCGWVTYCMDKCLAGEKINEDILLDVTGEKVTDDTKTSVHTKLKSQAASILMNRYDDFWETH